MVLYSSLKNSTIKQLFLLLRKLQHDLMCVEEKDLPLDQPKVPLVLRSNISLSRFGVCEYCSGYFILLNYTVDEGDLIPCNVTSRVRNGRHVQARRFMLVDPWRLVLLEPNSSNLGMGIVRYGGRALG